MVLVVVLVSSKPARQTLSVDSIWSVWEIDIMSDTKTVIVTK